jgi:hypothetical protein
LPSFYVTLAPSDTDSQLVMRLGSKRKQAAESDDIVEIPLPLDRQRLLAMNPVAAAQVFGAIVETLFERIFGLQLSHKTKSTGLPPGSRPMGSLGTAYNFFCVFEVQGRG